MGEMARIGETGTAGVRRAQSLHAETDAAMAEIAEGLGLGPFALIALFVSADRDPDAVADAVARHLRGQCVIGASTAGEIGPGGHLDGAITAIGLPLAHFRAEVMVIRGLTGFSARETVSEVLHRRSRLAGNALSLPNEFAFLLIDGLSLREDALVSTLGPALGGTPLFGGSAGDGVRFGCTRVLAEGVFASDVAALAFIRTRCRIKVFRFDHLLPTDRRMVVTDADPATRIVRGINAEPAARAYARALGRDAEGLAPFAFAAHPVVVRSGGQHHVLAVQRIEPDGSLRFFSAIDEGMVLTLAEGQDIAAHLERALEDLSPEGPPEAVIACECILRRLEIEERQLKGAMRPTLARHNVVGFNSYGEQFNMLHVNQTFTGVAIYPPPETVPR